MSGRVNNSAGPELQEIVYSIRLVLEKLKSIQKQVLSLETIVNGNNLNDRKGLYSKVQELEEELAELTEKMEQKVIKDMETYKKNHEYVVQNATDLSNRLDKVEKFVNNVKNLPTNLGWFITILSAAVGASTTVLVNIVIPIFNNILKHTAKGVQHLP